MKDVVKKVESGLEGGVGADPEWGEWKPGDKIECFDLVDRVQTLESASDELGKKVDEIKAAEEREKKAAALAAEQAKAERLRRAAGTPRRRRRRLGDRRGARTQAVRSGEAKGGKPTLNCRSVRFGDRLTDAWGFE